MKRNSARNASTGMLSALAERRSMGKPRMAKAALVTPTPPEFERLYQKVLDRAELLYPSLDRMIAGVQVVPRSGGGYKIDVASLG
jgi:hypothetical protein